MNELFLNKWHCDSDSCGKIFYVDLEDEIPISCPYCEQKQLSDSWIMKAQKIGSAGKTT